MQGILFIRKYPLCLVPGLVEGLRRSFNSVFGWRGQKEKISGHEVTFLFPGYGKHIRKIPASIIADINSGKISDIVDFGAAGALDPKLKIGDLVLSDGDICTGDWFHTFGRRPEAEAIVRKMANEEGRAFYAGGVLTSTQIVTERTERLLLREQYDAVVIQMEHNWFVDKLRVSVAQKAFYALHFTHLELVSDEVPRVGASRMEGFINFIRAMDICVFRNDKHLGRLKVKFLKAFIASQS